jgi:16S rRNA (guanine527-N7)-methyltransferase
MDRVAFEKTARDIGLSLSSEQLDAFEEYEEKLYSANNTRNLTRVNREECWIRHFIDSLLFQDLIPQGSRVLDIGTGPGLPAWPLACARPDLKVTAIDSNGKMLNFLLTVRLPNLSPVLGRAEETDDREMFDVVTGRALAPLPAQVEVSAGFCKVGGLVLPMRTPKDPGIAERAAMEVGLKLKKVHIRTLPVLEAQRAVPEFEKVAVTPYKYPRRWREILRRPLQESPDKLADL